MVGSSLWLSMFTDDMSRMGWAVLINTKDEAAEASQWVIIQVAGPEGVIREV